MKIISLNTWGGRAGKEELLAFIAKHREDTDIFCFQEVWSAPYNHLEGLLAGGRPIENAQAMVYGLQEITALLADHQVYFHPNLLDNYGLAMFIKKNFLVTQNGEVYVHKYKGYVPEGDAGFHARNVQYVTLEREGAPCSILNFHGLWNGKGKGDSEDRIAQSTRILEFTKTLNHPFVFCGDFNLLPDTMSIGMLEDAGMRNLIKEYGVQSTRSPLYTKEEKYADYIFTSSEIAVLDFRVLQDVVSDHLPLSVTIA